MKALLLTATAMIAGQDFPLRLVLRGNIADRTRFEDGKLAVGTWRYRLCIVTVFGDRWVSPVVTVKIGPGDLRRDPPTEADFE